MWTQWTSETAPIFTILSGKTKNYSFILLFYLRQCRLRVKKETKYNKVQRKRWKPENRILNSGIQPLMVSGIHRYGTRNPRLSWITLHGANQSLLLESSTYSAKLKKRFWSVSLNPHLMKMLVVRSYFFINFYWLYQLSVVSILSLSFFLSLVPLFIFVFFKCL